ncbi:MAG: Serine-tRNA ligase, partial [candidate division CPR3 bacterium GW2011_GWE2_35_7]
RKKRNEITQQINKTTESEREELIKTAKSIRKELKKEEEKSEKILLRWRELMDLMANVTNSNMPVGKDDSGNVEIKSWGGKPKHKFSAKHHLDLGESLGLIDVKKSALISGSRFYYLLNDAVSLEFALFNYVFQKLISRGFAPIETPVLVREKALYGTGYFPFENDQVYKIEKHNLEDKNELYLTGTSEQAIVSYHMDDLLKGKMPKKYLGYSPCFRSEVGSWGKDVRGIKRVHQFNKLEMIYFTTPETSQKYMVEALAIEEEILQELELPYHVLEMCTGDVGMATHRKWDVEVFLPSQQEYCETMSNSDLASYHARRLNIKYQKEDGSRDYVHTISATAITNTRIILAIFDNFQQEDGSIRVPKILQQYLGKEVITK